jgi:hypothetical protein
MEALAEPLKLSFQQVALLADAIGLSEPRKDFTIEFLTRVKAERMYMISRRNIFDLSETRIFQATSQDDVTNESIFPEHYCRETHPHLKRDARFSRNNAHGTAAFY